MRKKKINERAQTLYYLSYLSTGSEIFTLLFHILQCCCCCFKPKMLPSLLSVITRAILFFKIMNISPCPCMNCYPPTPSPLYLSLDIFCPQLDWTLRIMMTECCSAACNTRASTQSVLSSCAREFFPSPSCNLQLPLQSVRPLQIIHMHVTVSGSSQIVPARHNDCARMFVLSMGFWVQFRDFFLTSMVDGPLYSFTSWPFDLFFLSSTLSRHCCCLFLRN